MADLEIRILWHMTPISRTLSSLEVAEVDGDLKSKTPKVRTWVQKPQGKWRPHVLSGQGSSCGLERLGLLLISVLFSPPLLTGQKLVPSPMGRTKALAQVQRKPCSGGGELAAPKLC